MSSLVLMETRIPRKEGPDAVVTAEWFKAHEGARQYRVTWGAAEIYAQRGTRYYDTAAQAVTAAQRCARLIYKTEWE